MHHEQSALPVGVGKRGFRQSLGLFTTGITVVSARDDLHVHGMTVNSFSSVSLEPPLVLVCVHRGRLLQWIIHRARTFAVSVLAADQEATARHFADRCRPAGISQFASAEWFSGPLSGAPLLSGSLAWLECALYKAITSGDHEILVGQVLWTAQSGRRDPLLFFASRYHPLGEPHPSSIAKEVRPWESSEASSTSRTGTRPQAI
jgi:flavin reductase (DIM6/NTAB) family NADH-FMN oxidoreductase RutF